MMNLSFKDTQFIIEAIDNLIDNYQERIEAIQDIDEDEASDLGNDCMFLECLRQDLAKSLQTQLFPVVIYGDESDRVQTSVKIFTLEQEPIASLIQEIEQTPPEYWPNLLEMIRLFRKLEQKQIASLIQEIEQTPPEYWPNLLEMIRLFCKSVTKAQQSSPAIAVTHLPKFSQAEQMKRNQAAIELLRQWREEGDEQEQIETAEYLRQVLDEDRLSNRPLFP